MAKQTIKQRKAIRSAAALKGWQTRRDNDLMRRAREIIPAPTDGHRLMSTHDLGCWWHRFETDGVLEPYITPTWPFVAPKPPSLWQRIKRWFA